MSRKSITQVLQEHTPRLMAIPDVVGTGQGSHAGKDCILVLVIQRSSRITQEVPKQLEGYPVVIRVTGEIRARGDAE